MSPHRMPRFLAAALGLLLLAALLWLPADLDARRAPVLPKDLSSDLALVPGDCVGFITFRQSDLRSDLLLAAILELSEVPLVDEALIHVAAEQIERMTIVTVGHRNISIVRTSKPYDSASIIKKLQPGRSRTKGRDKEPELTEQKIGGKTIAYKGDPSAEAVCLVDRHVFALGSVEDLKHLLNAKAKHSEEMVEALGQAGKHTLVACVQGKLLRAQLTLEEARSGTAPKTKATSPPSKDKEKPAENKESEEISFRKQKATDSDRKTADDPFLPVELLPYKPLFMARTLVVTADVKPNPMATVKITFEGKADRDMGETALKTTLYVGRQLVGSFARPRGPMSDIGYMVPLKVMKKLRESGIAAFRAAKIERKGTTLQTTVSLPLDATERKTLGKAMIEIGGMNRAKNNLKQMALAMHIHNDAYACLPPPAITDAKGKALLSWRVAILPFIEQQNLYLQFKLDEPWDSPHNKKLLAQMPKVYAPVGIKTKQPYSTFYQLCTGPNTPWPTLMTKARIPATFQDGTSNTFLIVEAATPVEWTRPQDVEIAPKKPLPAFGAQFKGIFLVGMGDGSVHSLPRDADPKVLRLLIDPADGQATPPLDKIGPKK